MDKAGLAELIDSMDDVEVGSELHALITRMYPICRSITGDGVRETLSIVRETLPLEIHEVPTGTPVFDWTVPREWNIRDAYIKSQDGRKIVDFNASNLHVVSYSVPVQKRLSLADLKQHLHTLPEHPDWVPYRTSYYEETWGFCMSHREMQNLKEGEYEVLIDSDLTDGSLTYGEYVLAGSTNEEILIFAHICHPSLCNDNLSGVSLATYLPSYLEHVERRYTYRIVFAPATIGSLTWLSRNEANLQNIRHGLVASVLGDPGDIRYKKSRFGDAEIDRAVLQTLTDLGLPFEVLEFEPWGYDERQFNAPGIRLQVGRLTRSPNGCYVEYHTSADDLTLVTPECLGNSMRAYLSVLNTLEGNRRFLNKFPKGEPQLGRRGLYRRTGGQQTISHNQLAILWVLNLSDGDHSLLDIAARANLPFREVQSVAQILEANGLLEVC